MEDEFDERIFALPNKSVPETADALGLLDEEDPNTLVGIYLPWNLEGNGSAFIYEMSSHFGHACLTTLGQEMPLGFACKMRIQSRDLVEVMEHPRLRKLRLHLLELRAAAPKALLALEYSPRNKVWAYRPLPVLEKRAV